MKSLGNVMFGFKCDIYCIGCYYLSRVGSWMTFSIRGQKSNINIDDVNAIHYFTFAETSQKKSVLGKETEVADLKSIML